MAGKGFSYFIPADHSSCFADPERTGSLLLASFAMETACLVDMAWSTKSIGQNNSLVAGQILIECQFTKLEAGVTNNLLSYSYHKEGDHYNYTCEKVCLYYYSFT